jgi:type IV pilus assembly protein PilB
MYIEASQLKEFVVDSGLVSQTDIEKALAQAEKTGDDFGNVLVSQGKISEDDLKRMQAYLLGVPYVDLAKTKIPVEILSLIPEPIARAHNIIAFKKDGSRLEVAMLDTDDLKAIDFIQKKTGLTIVPRLTSGESIKNALVQYQKSLKADFGDIIKKETGSITILQDKDLENLAEGDLKKLAQDLPVVRVVDTLLKHAILQEASDIHIEPMENELVVRYRIDGVLRDAMVLPKNAGLSITARLKVLASLKLDEKRLPQDGRFKIDLDGEKVSFRVSILPVYYGEKTVMRILRENAGGFTLESLGFHGPNLERIHEATKLANGLILTTGPTGSGKTTTLYTILDIVNTPDVNISTIEDPIEYQMKRVNQTQVKPEIGLTFASGLRSLVRQDPDIIMVGEVRDNETAGLSVNAALTGHLVLSTLHTNSAAGALPRLLDMKMEPFLLASTIEIIVGQRLVRKLSNNKEKYFLTKAGLASLGKIVDLDRMLTFLKDEKIVPPTADWDKVPFFKPLAGEESQDGYKGRIGIHEVLKMTSTLRELIMKSATAEQIEIQAKKEGMLTMIEDGIFKSVQGMTTIEEVLRVISQ